MEEADYCTCDHHYSYHEKNDEECEVMGCECKKFVPWPDRPNGLNDLEAES